MNQLTDIRPIDLKNNDPKDNSAAPYKQMAQKLFTRAPQSTNFNRLRKRLRRQAGNTIARFGMVPQNPEVPQKWLICLSGGKDSHALLGVLLDLKAHGDLPLSLIHI